MSGYDEKFACGKKGCKGTLVAYKIIDNKKESNIDNPRPIFCRNS